MRHFHLKRTGLFGVLLIAFFIVRFDAGALPGPLQSHVLSYATDMSVDNLFAGTNAARASQGLGALSLDSQLNTSAQLKAQDMANKDYWAHVAPDGTQPWYFFDQAGYVYVRAGENLAYGFNTSQGAVDGWMNSPTHRANILGDFHDVGFGIIDAPNYQSSGPQTIVVAHYGSKASSAPAPPPATPIAPASPSTTPSPPVSPATPLSPASNDPASPPVAPEPAEATSPVTTPIVSTQPQKPGPVQTGDESRVSVLSMLAGRNLPLAALVSLALVGFAVSGFALTHRSAFMHAVTTGEQFVIRHPGIDTVAMTALTSLILLTTYGTLR